MPNAGAAPAVAPEPSSAPETVPVAAEPAKPQPTPTPGEIVIMAAGVVMLIFSFLPFYSLSTSSDVGTSQSLSWSGWSNAWSLFPLVPLMVVLAVAMAVFVALGRFGTFRLPERLGPMNTDSAQIVLSVLMVLTIVAYLIRNLSPVDKGIGAWFLVIGAAALVVGQILVARERANQETAGS